MAMRDDGRMERPIQFTGEMVRAILDGRKTQTRRVVKPQPSNTPEQSVGVSWVGTSQVCYSYFEDGINVLDGETVTCPYGKPGDLLWVQEEWFGGREPQDVCYRVACPCDYNDQAHEEYIGSEEWNKPESMPRRVSRILLEIVSVRVERVQDISPQDCIDDGVVVVPCAAGEYGECTGCLDCATEAFVNLWDSIYYDQPSRSWIGNPWVFVVEFKRVKA